MSIGSTRKTLDDSSWILDGRRSPMSLRRTNYLTNSELEYAVKKDMGCRIEPYGLVPALSMKQRDNKLNANGGSSRLDFLAKQLDLVTAELNESIGRVSTKKLRQIMDKLNVLRNQMNVARYEEDRPRRQAIQQTYSPRNVYSATYKPERKSLYSSQEMIATADSNDFDNIKNEMLKLVQNPNSNTMKKPPRPHSSPVSPRLMRSSSAQDLNTSIEPAYFVKQPTKFSMADQDILDYRDPLVHHYFPTTAKFQSEIYSSENVKKEPRYSNNLWATPSNYLPRNPYSYNPAKYCSPSRVGDLTTEDVVDLAERTDFDPSSFQLELLRLKAEKLHLEEEAMLEVRRLAELERLREPKKQWYSLRNSNFWYEAAKNNQKLKEPWHNAGYRNYMGQYQNSLARASTAFQKRWSSERY